MAKRARKVAVRKSGERRFEKKHYRYGAWTKGKFSEIVVTKGPGRMLFLAGVGAEDENNGKIRHIGDVAAQNRYAYQKIRKVLAKHGATLNDVVKQTTYVTDIRYYPACGETRREAYGFPGKPLPAHTMLNVSQLAWPGMLVEIDVIAVVGEK
jgi:enamine deaminase RidA (YjgF/YER057c/UK114 family)